MNKGNNPGWRDEQKQIKQTKTTKVDRVFCVGNIAGGSSETINLNLMPLYFHKLRVLIYNNYKETLFCRRNEVILKVFEKGQ